MKHSIHLLVVFCCICNTILVGQATSPSLALDNGNKLVVKKINTPVETDGSMEEPFWSACQGITSFWQNFPSDSISAQHQTEIYMAYDETNLYIAAKCHVSDEDFVIPSLRRDYRAGGNDNITLLFDPFNDRTNAFVFGMNPLGVRREALISNGGAQREDFLGAWDNKWKGEAKIHDGYWVAEFAIPFKTLRFKAGSKLWRFNSYRFDTQTNEISTWMQIPRNQLIMSLAFMGEMEWETELEKQGPNIALIPYVSAGTSRDFEDPTAITENTFNIGGDAKIAVSSGLNLDLTVLPDFSQVEVDRQVTNLDRFELFFPERRQFFLENSDLFGSFGNERINPFFSRRIGVVADTLNEENTSNNILYGARLSGKLNNNWRVGLLNMQTAKSEGEISFPGYNFTVAALQRKLFARSNIGLIVVNKQTSQAVDGEEFTPYNRVIGLDYNLASSDNEWRGKFFYHQGLSSKKLDKEFAHGVRLAHTKLRYQLQWEHRWVGESYDAEVGFVPRTNYFYINPGLEYFFYAKDENSKAIQYGPGLNYTAFWTPGLDKTDHQIELSWTVRFKNQTRLRINLQQQYTYLQDEFDPTGTDSTPLEAFTDYTYNSINGSYRSDSRKKLFYDVRFFIGEFFNGQRYGIRGSLTYRFQPYGSINLDYAYNYIQLPEPYETKGLALLGPRIDITFTKKIFLTTFFQYNQQADNLNINARFQWRFAPVSDFFIVYTDNYFSNNFGKKNRGVVAKFTYWLNL